MFCTSCGERAGWRCSKCGHISDRSWLLVMGAVSWTLGLVTTFLYLWRLLPTWLRCSPEWDSNFCP